MEFYDFMLYNPNYRNMSNNSKLIYMFLRNSCTKWNHEEETAESIKPMQDTEGNLFYLMEHLQALQPILNIGEMETIQLTEQLIDYGLIQHERIKGQDRLYLLEPPRKQKSISLV